MNIALGGEEQISFTGVPVASDGKHGHLYIHHMSCKEYRPGGIMIGVEGSEPLETSNASGEHHGSDAKSAHISPTFGFKWCKHTPRLNQVCNGPKGHDSLLIDLSGGWEFLLQCTFVDQMVAETALQPSMENGISHIKTGDDSEYAKVSITDTLLSTSKEFQAELRKILKQGLAQEMQHEKQDEQKKRPYGKMAQLVASGIAKQEHDAQFEQEFATTVQPSEIEPFLYGKNDDQQQHTITSWALSFFK